MGNYLSSPCNQKVLSSGSSRNLRYAAAEMQGWRFSMEDAHLILTDINSDSNFSLFCVFDGHGGSHVAKFAAKYFADAFMYMDLQWKGNYEKTLIGAYLLIDQLLESPDMYSELAKLKRVHLKDTVSSNSILKWFNSKKSRKICASPKCASYQRNSGEALEHIESTSIGSVFEKFKKGKVYVDYTEEKTINEVLDEDSKTQHNASDKHLGRKVKPFSYKIKQLFSKLGNSRNLRDTHLAKSTGSTAICALLRDMTLYVANVGDSRAVMCREGKAIELTNDHKPSLSAEKIRIYRAGCYLSMGRVNGNLNLSRAFGDFCYKQSHLRPEEHAISAIPDITTFQLCDQDNFLLIACDGIWEYVSSQAIVDFISGKLNSQTDQQTLENVLQSLFDELISPNPAIFEYGCDNMTAILIYLKDYTQQFN